VTLRRGQAMACRSDATEASTAGVEASAHPWLDDEHIVMFSRHCQPSGSLIRQGSWTLSSLAKLVLSAPLGGDQLRDHDARDVRSRGVDVGGDYEVSRLASAR
jgi:hypothetical protein